MISTQQRRLKRGFDLVLSLVLVPLALVPILILVVIATLDTKAWGVFTQKRIGQYGEPFNIYKIRTLRNETHLTGQLHQSASGLGNFLRQSKLDELPQLLNVLKGDMGFVGPRPDIPGYADMLQGADRTILQIRPGITGPATIKYKDEDKLLAKQENPQYYNDHVIWRDKVQINKYYIENWSFCLDLRIIIKSLINWK